VNQAPSHVEPPPKKPQKQQNRENRPKHALLRRGELRPFRSWMPSRRVKLTL
jgi:hypothetical protein